MAPLSPTRSRKRPSDANNDLRNYHGMAPFPDNVPTAPLLQISLEKLLGGDGEERERLWKACCDLGFFYLDLRRTSPTGSGNKAATSNYGGTEVDGEALLRFAEELFLVQKSFFKLPVEEKQKYDYKDRGSYFG
jgi:isopenicillin N synthase-like dioxygenase